MKKILFLLVALFAITSMNAQIIKVMKDGKPIATYKGSQVDEVVFENITGTAKRTGGIDVKWVQLWKNGPKFAEYNVGAANNKPEDYGGLYRWGGIEDRGTDRYEGYNGPLPADYDTATRLWGDNWRMPTTEELNALINEENCSINWFEDYNDTGSKGYLITGRGDYEDCSIFIPAAGYCKNDGSYIGNTGTYSYLYYLSSTDFSYISIKNDIAREGLRYYNGDAYERLYYYSVRPVRKE